MRTSSSMRYLVAVLVILTLATFGWSGEPKAAEPSKTGSKAEEVREFSVLGFRQIVKGGTAQTGTAIQRK